MAVGEGKKGRPRDAVVDERLLAATRSVLEEVGYARLTMSAVAARAAVGKPSLYRRYPTKALLVFDAVFGRTRSRPVPEGGEVGEVLREAYTWFLEEFADPAARNAVPGLLAELASNPALAGVVYERVIGPEYSRVRAVLERGQRDGRLRADVDLDLVIDAFLGTALARAVLLDREDVDLSAQAGRVVALLLDGIGTDSPAPRRSGRGSAGSE